MMRYDDSRRCDPRVSQTRQQTRQHVNTSTRQHLRQHVNKSTKHKEKQHKQTRQHVNKSTPARLRVNKFVNKGPQAGPKRQHALPYRPALRLRRACLKIFFACGASNKNQPREQMVNKWSTPSTPARFTSTVDEKFVNKGGTSRISGAGPNYE